MQVRGTTIMYGVLAACLSACGDSSNTGGEQARVCVAHNAPEPTTLAAPLTSFETEVAPILVRSCAFSSCHGSRGPGNHGLFLGAKSGESIDEVKTALLAPAKTAPAMAYVTPGDPDKSFVMHKLDGDQCVVEQSCAGGDCGGSMPAGNELLPEASRDAFRRWIAQGAR